MRGVPNYEEKMNNPGQNREEAGRDQKPQEPAKRTGGKAPGYGQ